MRIVYSVKDICDYVGATTAKCQLPIFGRWCDMTITAYCLGDNPFDATAVAMSYGIRPLPQKDVVGSSFDATQDGIFRLSRDTNDGRQQFDQQLDFPTITGQFFDKQTMAGGGVPVARNLIRGVLRGTESMIETIRQTIRCSFPDSISEFALQRLDDRFGKVTAETINSFLGEIHWRLMLQKSGCDDQQYGCIEFMAIHNPPRFHAVDFSDDADIPLVGEKPGDIIAGMRDTIRLARAARAREEQRQAQEKRDLKMAVANNKARSLLESVCGSDAAREFDTKGFVTIKQDGYKFEISANDFTRCTDPNGKTAELCIHTLSFSCNPIDEIIIAYLHIKHKLAAYMREAIPHGAQRGFQQVPA